MTNAMNTLTGMIGSARAEFYTKYFANGYKMNVYTLDGEFVIEDERGSVLESSFETGKDVQQAAGRWNVTNAVGHMEKAGEKIELSVGEVEETTEAEEGNEVEVASVINTAAELIAEGADVIEVIQMITIQKGYDIGGKVRDHFHSLYSK